MGIDLQTGVLKTNSESQMKDKDEKEGIVGVCTGKAFSYGILEVIKIVTEKTV